MSLIRLTPFHASLFVLSSQGLTDAGDPYTFRIDASRSQVGYEIESNLGSLDLGPTASGTLSGELAFVLLAGMLPVSDGQMDGGPCACDADLAGSVPNSTAGLPPLLRIRLESLAISPVSAPFELDAKGEFCTQTACEVTHGTLEASFPGRPPRSMPIGGIISDAAPARGRLWIDGEGIHVVSEFVNCLVIDDPALDLHLCVRIRGRLRGDLSFASVQALDDRAGGRVLLAAHCPPNSIGLFVLGDLRDGVSPGKDARCIAGQVLRLQAFDRHAPPTAGLLLAGSPWGFQFGYRAAAADAAGFDVSDTSAVDFVP